MSDKQEVESYNKYIKKITQQAREVIQPHIDACIVALAKVISKRSN